MDSQRKGELGQQLCDAAADGKLSRVESLIAEGADVNHIDTDPNVSTVHLPYGVTIMIIVLSVYYYYGFLIRVMVVLQVDGLVVG
jgi:hypothetical protein